MAAMEATLKIAARPFSKGIFLYSTPTYPAKMDLIGQGVLLEIDGRIPLPFGKMLNTKDMMPAQSRMKATVWL